MMPLDPQWYEYFYRPNCHVPLQSAMYVDDSMLCDVGHVLLVTDVERSPLPSSLRDVVAKRFNVPDDQMMNIAGQPLSPHADFRLVLSSSVPLCVRGMYTGLLLSYCCFYHFQSLSPLCGTEEFAIICSNCSVTRHLLREPKTFLHRSSFVNHWANSADCANYFLQ